jgi:tRNA(Ile)-lysidine synthase TilS/MesJ
MTDKAGATSMIVRPPFDVMKSAFKKAAEVDFYSPKTLDRASSICTTCIGVVKSMVLRTAIEMNIPLVAYGWSPGQAPISSAIMQTSSRMQLFTNKSVRDPLIEKEPLMAQYFLSENDMKADKERWPVNIHPLAFFDYDEEEIIKNISGLGWEKPSDTDSNSTNCLLNGLANYLHKKKFGFHPYAWEIAGIVRSGSMVREDGIEKINQEENAAMVKLAAEKIGLKL